ncbi:MAG TPA: TRAP transporter substrate-binding protein [Hyphomicrobiaceae bacterium]|nr:TRAP transporter substrate-binding protein [Hyphomicrobiaceae bacterium]
MTTHAKSLSRRKFLKASAVTAGAAASATVAMPQVSRAQTVTWKYQSTWPTKDIFHEFAVDYAKKVNDMSGGRLKLDVLAAGAVVPAFQVQDAVHSGVLDGGHGVTVYWYGKNKAASLFGTPPSMGWDAHSLLAWFYHGGGEALYNELINDILKINAVGFLYYPMPNQPLGWFKKEIKNADDFKGMKYRTVGLSADLFKEMGAAVTILPGGEIVPAIDRGLIDGAEFNNPSSDLLLGFPDVSKNFMVRSHHQQGECFELSFNKAKFNALAPELKSILRYAALAATADQFYMAHDRYSKDLEAIRARGVNVIKTPDSVLEAQLKAWDTVIAANKDPYFVKVLESQRAWCKRVVPYFLTNNLTTAQQETAYKHFFG